MEHSEKKFVSEQEEIKETLEKFKLEELEERLEMSDFANPSPPRNSGTGGSFFDLW